MIIFDDKKHTYFNTETGKYLLSVTQLMRKHNLAPNYADIPDEILQKAAAYGSMVHKEIEDYNKDGSVGFSWELGEYIKAYKENDITSVANEFIVYNDIVCGTVDELDLLKNGFELVDHKTTYEVHTESVSWQTSIYAYLIATGNVQGCNVNPKYEEMHGRVNWFDKKSQSLQMIPLTKQPIEEIEKLMECERKGEIYQKPALNIEKTAYERAVACLTTIKQAKKMQQEAEQYLEEFKNIMADELTKRGLKSVDNELIRVTKTDASSSLTFDEALFKKEHPEMWEQYKTKVKTRKGYVTVTLRGEDNENK